MFKKFKKKLVGSNNKTQLTAKNQATEVNKTNPINPNNDNLGVSSQPENTEIFYQTELFTLEKRSGDEIENVEEEIITQQKRDEMLVDGDIKISPKYYVKPINRPIKNFTLGLIMFAGLVFMSIPLLYLNPKITHQVGEFKEIASTLNNINATAATNSKNKSKDFQTNDNNRTFNLSFNSTYLTTNQEFLKNNKIYEQAYPIWLKQQGIEPTLSDAVSQIIKFDSTEEVLKSVYELKTSDSTGDGKNAAPNSELIKVLNADGTDVWNVEKYKSRYEYFLLNIIMNQVILVGGNSPIVQLNSKFDGKSPFFMGIKPKGDASSGDDGSSESVGSGDSSGDSSQGSKTLKWYEFTPKTIFINFVKNLFKNLVKLELVDNLSFDEALSIYPSEFFKVGTNDLEKKFKEYLLTVQSKLKKPEELSSITQLFPNNWIRNRRQTSSEKITELETLNKQLSDLKNTENLIKYGIIPNREIGNTFKLEDFPDVPVGYGFSDDYLAKETKKIDDFNKKFESFVKNNLIAESDRGIVFSIDHESVARFVPNLNNLKWESSKLEESVEEKWKEEEFSNSVGNLWSNYLKIIPIGFKGYTHYKIKSIVVNGDKVTLEINVYNENLIKMITVTDLDLKNKSDKPQEFK